jgi:hypothetical protein
MTRTLRVPLALIAAGLLSAGLVACTGDSDASKDPKPSAGGSSSASPGAGGGSGAADKLAAQYLAATPTAPAVLATVKGTVRTGEGKDVPGRLDLLAVQAGPGSTAVRWRMATDQPIDSISSNYYRDPDRPVQDTSLVVLVAKSADLRLDPAVWSGSGPSSDNCTCSWNPTELGPDGLELSSLYPALPAEVTEVELRVPGFPAVTGPVSRS